MPNTFHGINLTAQALRVFQRAMDVTSHNIANANTPGYSRQTIELAELDGIPFWMGRLHMLGNGVTIAGITRARDTFLESRLLGAQGELSRNSMMAGALREIETVLAGLDDDGISVSLSAFFNAWSGLASDPNNAAQLFNVRAAGQTLADKVRTTFAGLQAIQADLQSRVPSTLADIDALSQQIADLNARIRSAATGGTPTSDLLDSRNLAIAELSELVDVRTQSFADGTVSVFTSGLTLVDSAGWSPIPKSYDLATGSLLAGSVAHRIGGGTLGGLIQAAGDASTRMAALDTLANTLRTQINALHATGTNRLGATGVLFFNDSAPQSGAADFDLDAAIKASADAIASGVSGAAGDGGLALALSGLRDTQVAALGNRSFGAYFAALVAEVGSAVRHYETFEQAQRGVLRQIQAQIQSVAGVSLDDEMANMMRYQRSYQAAAQALKVLDETTEDLIGILAG